jgi:CRISPR/Cas system-associated protein Csx1
MVMQNDNSSKVRELFCDLMDTKANIHLDFSSIGNYLQWFAQNRVRLTNNPTPTAK